MIHFKQIMCLANVLSIAPDASAAVDAAASSDFPWCEDRKKESTFRGLERTLNPARSRENERSAVGML